MSEEYTEPGGEDDAWDREMAAWIEAHTPDPAFQALLDQVTALFEAHDRKDARKVGEGFYFDADGVPRTRFKSLRVVRDEPTG